MGALTARDREKIRAARSIAKRRELDADRRRRAAHKAHYERKKRAA